MAGSSPAMTKPAMTKKEPMQAARSAQVLRYCAAPALDFGLEENK
jgi:hypothetical protein